MDDAQRKLETIKLKLHELESRAMAHEAVFNAVLLNWGAPREVLTTYLDQTAERLEAVGLQMPAPEQSLDAIRLVMQQARQALASPPFGSLQSDRSHPEPT